MNVCAYTVSTLPGACVHTTICTGVHIPICALCLGNYLCIVYCVYSMYIHTTYLLCLCYILLPYEWEKRGRGAKVCLLVKV